MNLATNKSGLEQQLEDMKRLNAIFEKINRLSNDFAWANAFTDDLFMHQPFLLSMLTGYQFDLSALELDEALKLYIAVWEYFKVNPKVKTNAITEAQFDRFHNINIKVFVVNDPADRETMTVLLAAIFERFVNRPVLFNMETQTKGALMIGVKSIIECFEEITS
ncbi:MAG: hypothetical protein M0Q26_09965 [Chitinophagaceae bacterium]|nr:hypothetical protein [Chitinophagaceae bacterium]MDP1763828.1 hypothetical protein [Sediminibacterium sp.]